MPKPYYVGSYSEDAKTEPNYGWIVGKFKQDAPRKNNAVEVKYWEFSAGPTDHPLKESATIECTFVLKGAMRGVINGQAVTLRAGDYVVIEPGTPNNIAMEALEDVVGLTVKAPSDPSAKKLL